MPANRFKDRWLDPAVVNLGFRRADVNVLRSVQGQIGVAGLEN